MEHPITAFVSFRSLNIEIVRHVFARLTAQGLRPWNYEVLGDGILVSQDIPSRLEEQVRNLDCFIPIITPESMAEDSEYTRIELECALRRRSKDDKYRIIPIVCGEVPPPEVWSEPFRELRQIKHVRFDPESLATIETAILEIDLVLHLDYVPPTVDKPRLPFMASLYQEISGKVSHRKQDNTVFVALIQCAADFMAAFESSDYPQALRTIAYFIGLCEYHYPEGTFYYPYVAQIAALLAHGDFERVEPLARALLKPEARTDDPWVALAVVAFHRGDYGRAATCFERALAVPRDLPHDVASKAGLMACRLLSGQEVDVNEALKAIERVPHAPSDARQLAGLKAFALLQSGRLHEADQLYRELSAQAPLTVRQTENCARVLSDLGRLDEGIELLRSAIARAPSALSLRQALIAQLLRSGRKLEARTELDPLVACDGLDRNLLGFAAQVLHGLGAKEAAQTVAARLLDDNAHGFPKRASDFYHCGAANWILNRRERAEYDFERSGVDAASHYRTFLA